MNFLSRVIHNPKHGHLGTYSLTHNGWKNAIFQCPPIGDRPHHNYPRWKCNSYITLFLYVRIHWPINKLISNPYLVSRHILDMKQPWTMGGGVMFLLDPYYVRNRGGGPTQRDKCPTRKEGIIEYECTLHPSNIKT